MERVANRYGRLQVLSYLGSYNRSLYYECVCDCGNITQVNRGNLLNGTVKSCGCLEQESRYTNTRIHGMVNSPTYHVWQAMKARCNNPNNIDYINYGGRGITVCERWGSNFLNFFADMGEKPADRTIDRIDTNGNYSAENCRWATIMQQAANKRNNRIITARYNGKIVSAHLAEWSRITGIDQRKIGQRIYKLGWDADRALFS